MNFRRVFTALAVLAVFAMMANAQVITPSPINCSVTAGAAPAVRSEGVNERVGDIVITCTGGQTPALGSVSAVQVDKASIVVDFGVPVTSRLETIGGLSAGASEALLLVDEPATVLPGTLTPGWGPSNAALSVCPATAVPAAACATFGQTINGYWVLSNTAVQPPVVPAANAYQGTNGTGANANKVTFTNVPVLAPVASNVTRVYRITNIRVTPGAAASITASVTVTPNAGSANALTLTNNSAVVAAPQAGLSASVVTIGAASLCATTDLQPNAAQAKANLAILTFKETFATAFRTRVLPIGVNAAGLAQGVGATQNSVTGTYTIGGSSISSFGSESGYVGGLLNAGGITTGLADSGTRLKALFTKLDPKATYFVSVNNVSDYATVATPPTIGNGDQTVTAYAALVGGNTIPAIGASEAAVEGTYAAAFVGKLGNSVIPVFQLVPQASGNAEVVWEVVNGSAGTVDTLSFAVYAVYNNNATPPTIGNIATVTLGFAPTSGATAPGVTTTFVPRMVAPAAAGSHVNANIFNVVKCQTSLLFPYVTNVTGYETGMAVSNTSMDPFSTVTSAGSCSMYFYGQNQPAAPVALKDGAGVTAIAAGTMIANTASGLGLINFNGYAIAVCDFQFAHGFAFVQNRTQTLGMGYLPLVMQGGTGGNGRGQALIGEGLTQ